MPLVQRLELIGNPFEHYTAETEPNITEYAVRPPYLQAISDRAKGLSSFILFGNRGAGKSATRITVFKEIWKNNSDTANNKLPFIVNLTDFTLLQPQFKSGKLTDRDIVGSAAFVVIEQILVWLSSLEEHDRQLFIDGLNNHERTLVLAMIKGFYLNIPELDRNISNEDALKLLNSAWYTKSSIWVEKRWANLSAIIAAAVNAFSKHHIDGNVDITAPAEALLKSLTSESANTSRAIISKLVELVKAFGFSGVCVLVDKIDETPSTSNSADATAKLIHPLLTHIQLLEVEGFSWILFLWSKVQEHFNSGVPVRLDKIAHANISWESDSLREMLATRVNFFSNQKLKFEDFFDSNLDMEIVLSEITKLCVNSPRELIKLIDFIIREHDARTDNPPNLIDRASLDLGQDKYALETIGTWFKEKPLQQVLRLGKTIFVNHDVQTTFKISDQGARVRVNGWEDAGLVQKSGTAPSELGGKQVYRYVVADARIERIIARKLHSSVGAGAEEEFDES